MFWGNRLAWRKLRNQGKYEYNLMGYNEYKIKLMFPN